MDRRRAPAPPELARPAIGQDAGGGQRRDDGVWAGGGGSRGGMARRRAPAPPERARPAIGQDAGGGQRRDDVMCASVRDSHPTRPAKGLRKCTFGAGDMMEYPIARACAATRVNKFYGGIRKIIKKITSRSRYTLG